ncbi:MAG: hypothetical protein MUP14_07890 [Dehalococcoidia bacterium]|nr:hypothetical protein [Dehalococcoidia bacterium]
MSRHDIVWLVFGLYILGGIVYFGVAEGMAIHNRTPGDTLTEVLRALNLPVVAYFGLGGVILGVVAWAVPHLANKLGF